MLDLKKNFIAAWRSTSADTNEIQPGRRNQHPRSMFRRGDCRILSKSMMPPACILALGGNSKLVQMRRRCDLARILRGSRLPSKETLELTPRQAVQYVGFLQARAAGLIEAATHEVQLGRTMGVG
jgi:hypothetical protein